MKREIYIRELVFILIAFICICDMYSQERFETINMNQPNYNYFPRQNGLVTRDGGYLVVISVYDAKKQTYRKFNYFERVSKYDVNGNLLWYKDIKDFMVIGICELYDGSVVLCGPQGPNNWQEGEISQHKTAYIVKLNPCGDVEWAKIDKASDYPGSIYLNKLMLNTLIDTGDGLIFPYRSDATFQDPDSGAETYEFKTYLLKLDYEGKIIYRNGFDEYGSSQNIFGGAVDSDGNIWMTGLCLDIDPYGYYVNSPLILKCDRDGHLLYAKSSKDKEVGIYGTPSRYDIPLIDNNGTFFSIVPMTVIITGISANDNYVTSSMIKVNGDQNLTIHTIKNDDHDPEATCWMRGFDFVDGQEHIITSSRYVCKEIDSSKSRNYFNNIMDNRCYLYDNYGRRYKTEVYAGMEDISKSKKDDEILDWVRNRLFIIDKEGKVVDSLKLEGIFERGEQTEDIFTVENNQFIVTSYNDYVEGDPVYIRKFNRDFEPALIDNTPREYDTNCDKQITSGLVEPKYVSLTVSVDEIRSEIKTLRFSPNPANDKTRIYLSNGFGEKRIDVYDTNGKMVKTLTIDEGWAQSDMDVSDLRQGVYIVKLTVNGKLKGTEKLIIN